MLKKISAFVSICILILACGGHYGSTVNTASILPVSGLNVEALASTKQPITVSGKIGTCCQTEGCWFTFSGLTNVIVDFNNAFTIPKTSAGKTATATGFFYLDTTTVESQIELAKEEGKTVAEIGLITLPKINTLFRANGLILK